MGFQTTYEELKLNSRWPVLDNWDASRLPMRNWNISKFLIASSDSLPDYLWGIETHLIQVWRQQVALPDYLWGIETLFPRFISTQLGLPDYLWGIETLFSADWQLSVRLPDYLWGIETPRTLRSSRWFWLPDYLWGIETSYTLHTLSPSFPASRLPMRNWNQRIPCRHA